ncbi:MAG: N-acetylmuramoyl-L-alanine amidase [Comamonadaceae bacterium]|nr:N-acetylmuramoyl-L-alanine amidase [Comamonadaceae bacterium]
MLNASSIGIEIVHPGFRTLPDGERVYLPFPQAQIDALIPLRARTSCSATGIRPERVLGHSDVLPQYKEDPGPTFPWKRLADEGLIPWPDAQRVAAQRARVRAAAARHRLVPAGAGAAMASTCRASGELDGPTRRTMLRPSRCATGPANYDGAPDAETAALLHVLMHAAER